MDKEKDDDKCVPGYIAVTYRYLNLSYLSLRKTSNP